jgi:hypothetical protein
VEENKMPFASKKQRAYLHIHEPAIAARWEKEAKKSGKSAVQKKKKSFTKKK